MGPFGDRSALSLHSIANMKNPLTGKAHPEPFSANDRLNQTADCLRFAGNAMLAAVTCRRSPRRVTAMSDCDVFAAPNVCLESVTFSRTSSTRAVFVRGP